MKNNINIIKLRLKADGKKILAGFLLFSVSFLTVLSFFPKDSSADYNQYLNIDKTGRNVTRNDSSWQNTISINSGDRVSFSIRVEANGGYNVNNVVVSDNLPSQLSYASGSTRIDGYSAADGIVSNGINIGTINSDQSKTVTFEAYASSGLSTGTSFANYAYARGDNASQISDSMQIWVGSIGSGNPYLRISKTGRNVSRNETGWQKTVSASAGDRVAFLIQISNSSATQVNNAVISDSLPAQLSYSSGSTRIDGTYTALDSIVTSGLFIGTINSGQTRSVTFETTVTSGYSYSDNSFTNYAYARGDNASQVSDNSQITIGSYSGQYSNQQYPGQYGTSGIRYFTVSITSAGFSPNNLSARKGDRVTFINNDSTAHTVTNSAFGGQHVLQSGQSYALDTSYLNTIQYDYQCDFHPWMRGTLLVMEQTPIAQPQQPSQQQQQQQQIVVQQPVVKAVTGANSITLYAAAAATASGLAIVALYFLMLNAGWFTQLRLSMSSLAIKIKEKTL